MRKSLIYRTLVMTISIMLLSCFWSQAVAQNGEDVNYESLGGYSVLNDVKDGTLKLVIKSQKELDRVLHLSLVGGYIPPIDFDRYFMIVVVVPKEIAQVRVNPVSLKRNGNKLYFSYSYDMNNRTMVANRSYVAVLVDRKEPTKVVFQEVSSKGAISQNEPKDVKSLRQQLEYVKAENEQLKKGLQVVSAEIDALRKGRADLIQRLKDLEEENKRLQRLLNR